MDTLYFPTAVYLIHTFNRSAVDSQKKETSIK